MHAELCHICVALDGPHRRKIACFRGRRSRPWTPPLRLAFRVTVVAVIFGFPILIAGCYYVTHATSYGW